MLITPKQKMSKNIKYIILVFSLTIFSCEKNVEKINYNSDVCSHCRMVISDSKFGAEYITTKGKIYKFDSIECMAMYLIVGNVKDSEIHSLWFAEFTEPNKLVNKEKIKIYFSDEISSPMGLSLFASEKTEFENVIKKKEMSWSEVKNFVKKEWE